MYLFIAFLSLAGCNFGTQNFVITDHPDLDWDNDHVLDSVDDVVPVKTSWFSDEPGCVLVTPDLIDQEVTPIEHKLDLNNVQFVVIDKETAIELFGEL